MASTDRRPDAADPLRQHLVEVRRGLLRLHKLLIDTERRVLERERGPMSNGQFLQALITDPAFAWLRPFTGLITQVDEALADKEGLPEGAARDYLERARTLVEPEAGSSADLRYEHLRQRNPEVLLAHVELVQRISTALAP